MKRKITIKANSKVGSVEISVKLDTRNLTREESERMANATVSQVMKVAPFIPFADLDISDWITP